MMGEDDGKTTYPPNSADIMAMCDYIRTMHGQLVVDTEVCRTTYRVAGAMFVAWVNTLDIGGDDVP